MNTFKKRIASLLNEDESDITIIQENDEQCLVITKQFKNYVYFISEDTIMDMNILTNKKESEQYLTQEEKTKYYVEN